MGLDRNHPDGGGAGLARAARLGVAPAAGPGAADHEVERLRGAVAAVRGVHRVDLRLGETGTRNG